MAKGQSAVKLTPSQTRDFLLHIISNNRELQKGGKKPVSIEVIGEAGIGKTSLVDQVAKDNGLAYVKLNLAQIEELGD